MFDVKYLLLRIGIALLTVAFTQSIVFGIIGIDSFSENVMLENMGDIHELSKFDMVIIGLKGIFISPVGWIGFLLIGIYLYLRFIKQ